MPKISIIIPVYNVEKYLSKCLDSVINQTYKNLEILCVNDGSTDNSPAILEEYARKDDRIKILNKENGGLSSARNYGLDYATGNYCYFLDSDDWIELNTIEILIDKMVRNDVDCVVHKAINIPEDDSCTTMANGTQNWLNSFNKDDGVYEVPKDISKNIPTVAWNKLYKMDIIKKYSCRFPEGLINEDEAFIWTYMIHCHNYYNSNACLYNYLRRTDSIMGTRDNSPKVLDILKIQKLIFETVKKYKNIENYKKVLTNNYIDGIRYLWQRMPKKYRKDALKLIKDYIDNTNNDKRIKNAYRKLKFKKLNQFLQGIFSITNIKTDKFVGKQVKICGIKLKFKDKYKTLSNNIYQLQNEIKQLQNEIKQLEINQEKYVNNLKQEIKILTFTSNVAKSSIIRNKIVFNNFNGKGYGCNPKYIAEEIIKQKLPYELVWLVNDIESVKKEFPKEIKLVEYTVENAIKEFASAKVWISNQRMPQLYENGLYKKNEQFYIQTWHGWTPIKTIEKDVENQKQWWCKWAKVDSQYMNLLTASSQFDKRRLTDCFYFDGEISDVGIPRNDIFYCNEEQKQIIINKIYEFYNIPKDNRILLYAPTFRDDGRLDGYDIDIDSCISALEKKYSAKYTVVARLHPNVLEKAEEAFKFKNYIDATNYPDVMELLLASDIMITDYSCLMFEFMHTRKPVFLYGSDLDKYLKDRNFYIDIKSLFFSFAETNGQLISNIENFDIGKYISDVEKFIKKSGSLDNGLASKYIVDKISEVVSNDK